MESTDREEFVAGAAAGVHPAVRSWYTGDELLENVRAWLAQELRLVGDLAPAREFASHAPRAGAVAEDYASRVVDVGGGRECVAGIRLRPATGEFFVDLVASTRPFDDADELRAAARALCGAFAVFEPKWMRGFVADEALAAAATLPGDLVLAARIDELRAGAAASQDSVVLRPIGATVAYDHYLRMYREFHAEAPRNEELARIEDVETLAAFETDRGLFEIRVDGIFAGYCGARRASRYGVRGWLAGEIILNRRFRGQGHAAPVHRRLAESIPASPGDALWAEVHEDNVRSWRAGLAAGYVLAGRVIRVAV